MNKIQVKIKCEKIGSPTIEIESLVEESENKEDKREKGKF